MPPSSLSPPVAAAGALGCNANKKKAVPRPTVGELLEKIRQSQEAEKSAAASSAPSPIGKSMLTDRFGRTHNYLRISLTERCNLRCTYCMPAEGVALTPSSELLTAAEVQRLLRLFVQAGVTKLRLTGGEPTVRSDLAEIISSAASLRPQGLDAIGLTSNGLVLARKLPSLVTAGLTHLNISLDTLDPLQFELFTRRPAAGHTLVRRAIDEALRLQKEYRTALERGEKPERGLRSVKINCVVIKGINDKQIVRGESSAQF
jgi:cyclic pyranopterin phosphate synthase